VNHVICDLNRSSLYTLKVDGVTKASFSSGSNGCISFDQGASVQVKNYELVLSGGSADLSAGGLFLPAGVSPGTQLTVSVLVSNAGSLGSGPFFVRFYEGTRAFSTVRVGSVSPGYSGSVSALWTASTGGTRTIRVSVDYNNSVPEASEQNNEAFDTILVSSPADLSVVSADMIFSPSPAVLGRQVNITARIYKSGGLPANNVSV